MNLPSYNTRRILVPSILGGLMLGACLCVAEVEGDAAPAVRWAASLAPATVARGGSATVDVSAQIKEGWHVYAPEQRPGGPTPLRVTLENEDVAKLAGQFSGTIPQKKHDPSFDLDTLFFTHSLQLHVPVRLVDSTAGARVIPVSVHFQVCSDRECQPPATIHLDVPVDVRP